MSDRLIEFKTEEEAKRYAVACTSAFFTLEEAQERIQDYKTYIKNANTEEQQEYWTNELKKLEKWLSSEKFKNGDYSQGIDALILDLIELRASIYAFQNTKSQIYPFNKYIFHAQWLTGSTYTIFSIIGKLVSKDKRDNSLRKLWDNTSQYIEVSDLSKTEEINKIKDKMQDKNGHFTNSNSKALLYRNKFISHNESMPRICWSDIDDDIKIIVRLWSLITMWSSSGILYPFQAGEAVFSGLDNIYSQDEIKALINKRGEYLRMIKEWCVCSLIDGEQSSNRTPFATISFKNA